MFLLGKRWIDNLVWSLSKPQGILYKAKYTFGWEVIEELIAKPAPMAGFLSLIKICPGRLQPAEAVHFGRG